MAPESKTPVAALMLATALLLFGLFNLGAFYAHAWSAWTLLPQASGASGPELPPAAIILTVGAGCTFAAILWLSELVKK